MAHCELCGSEYEQAFDMDEELEAQAAHDVSQPSPQSFPICGLCGCRMTGYGKESKGLTYPSEKEQGFMIM